MPVRDPMRRIALSVDPASVRDTIPDRVTLRQNAPPYSGEFREEQTGRLTIQPGGELAIATLRRPWLYVAFAVDPGNAGAPGVTAILRLLNERFSATLATVVIAPGPPQAFAAATVGSRAELVILNPTAAAVTVSGALWGMCK